VEQEFGDVGGSKTQWHPHILCNNHMPCLEPWVLGMIHHPNPEYM
jgi:hypothetical protein